MKISCDYILMDVEGTTTELSFVKDVLFPYSVQHLSAYLQNRGHSEVVKNCLEKVKRTMKEESGQEDPSLEEIKQTLLSWIELDRKETSLKELQGMIWKEGYKLGDFKGHVYDDVWSNWRKWRAMGIRLGIYSSGSVEAQKLLFGHSVYGDLTPYLSDHFDTRIGPKREVSSYQQILKELSMQGKQVLFLSDIEEECDAANQAGMLSVQVVRLGTNPGSRHPHLSNFGDLQISPCH